MNVKEAVKIKYEIGQHRYYDREGLYMIISSNGKIIFESDSNIEKRKKKKEKR